MSDPSLDELIGAYRAVADRDRRDAEPTRGRVLQAVEARASRRRWLAAAAVVAAVFATNTTVWAFYTGRLDAPLAAVRAVFASRSSSSAEPASDSARARAGAPASTDLRRDTATAALAPGSPEEAAETVEPERSAATGSAEDAAETASRAPGRSATTGSSRDDAPMARGRSAGAGSDRAPSGPAPVAPSGPSLDGEAAEPAPAEPLPEPDPLAAERAAFTRAHAAHFRGSSWAAALALWDAYLADYPRGRFVPEARFNRAVALLRLGRRDAARRALRAIAFGEANGPHRGDANRLLRALDEGRVATEPERARSR